MPILIKPFLGCNIACKYCYEAEFRLTNPQKMDYDLDAIIKTMAGLPNNNRGISLHGGEILCLPKQDVDRLLAKSMELTGRSQVQTNGTQIDDEWIEIFKRNKTHVGISCDGWGELNSFRMDVTRTAKLIRTIHRLKEEGFRTSIISVLSRANVGTPDKFASFKEWLLELKDLKIGGRLNPCSATGNPDIELDMESLVAVYKDLTLFCMEHGLTWSPMSDLARKVAGCGAVCVFQGCDIYHTDSATVVLGDGSVTNCMRTSNEDILLRHPAKYNTRDEILQEIPQENGGCRGCTYWSYCRGGCPSTAIDDDWRNRTYLCELWSGIIEVILNARKFLNSNITKKTSKPKDQRDGHTDSHSNTPHVDTGRNE